MTLYVNSKTALRFWCMVATSLEDVSSACSIREVKNADTSVRAVDSSSLALISEKKKVIHALVESASRRTRSPRFVYHVRLSPYPPGAFRRIAHDVLIASPELCFFEMATELPFWKLVEFGYLLCGTYTLNPKAASTNNRKPLTTKRKLSLFINRMGSARGCAIAKKALKFIVEGSASVRETKTTILLCAPVRDGGYGLPWPTLNHRINFTDRETQLFGRSYVVLDLYWRLYHLGLEYDGEKDHSDESDVSRDRRKSSELDYHGERVIRVDKNQLANPYQVYVLAKKCARAMGKTIRRPTHQQDELKRQLFDAIMR